MARIAPFAGIHFDPNRVPLADVIAPPYDVLSPAQQDALIAKHPQNIIRLILNKERDGDGPRDRYERAAAFLHEALADGTLVADDAPAFYEYVQIFEHPLTPDRFLERRTLFVALGLEPYENGVVLPHEQTHPKAKADRLELMRATQANPEPIYGLYEDPQGVVARLIDDARPDRPILVAPFPAPTAADAEDPGYCGSDQHLVYRLSDPDFTRELEAFFAPLRVWIADGHHRYETALNYRRERREAEGDPNVSPSLQGRDWGLGQPYDFILIGLSAFEDSGLVVLPTHRLVKNVPAERMAELPLLLERYFHLHVLPVPEAREWIKEEVAGEKRFAVVLPDRAYALVLRDLSLADAAMEAGHCEAWKRLDVTILQSLVLDRTLGISWTALAHTPDVAYTRDEDEAVEKVASGEFQLACLLQNPTVTEVRDVASAGDKMPQKSTFFYPKLWSGLILRSLN